MTLLSRTAATCRENPAPVERQPAEEAPPAGNAGFSRHALRDSAAHRTTLIRAMAHCSRFISPKSETTSAGLDARTRLLSLEPLLGPLPGLTLDGVDWVIAGGESGPGARPMQADWVRHIRDRCVDSDVPFFFKQWGGVFKKRTGRTLDGRVWDEFPEARPQ